MKSLLHTYTHKKVYKYMSTQQIMKKVKFIKCSTRSFIYSLQIISSINKKEIVYINSLDLPLFWYWTESVEFMLILESYSGKVNANNNAWNLWNAFYFRKSFHTPIYLINTENWWDICLCEGQDWEKWLNLPRRHSCKIPQEQ